MNSFLISVTKERFAACFHLHSKMVIGNRCESEAASRAGSCSRISSAGNEMFGVHTAASVDLNCCDNFVEGGLFCCLFVVLLSMTFP